MHYRSTAGQLPASFNPYRAPQTDRVVTDGLVAELLDTGRAVESKSPYSSPVHLVKKDGKFRLVVVYKRLNKVIVRQIWPAARINNILAELAGSTFFTTLEGFKMLFIKLPLPLRAILSWRPSLLNPSTINSLACPICFSI
jgi:hypothetical protein